MTAEWMLRAMAAGTLLGLAALAADRAAGWLRLPRRWVWASAMAGSLLLPALAVAAPGALPELRLPALASAGADPPPREASTVTPGVDGAPDPAATPPAPRRIPREGLLAWLATSLAVLCALVWSQRRVWRACGPCVAQRVCGTRVLVSERAGPMVLGLVFPQVVVPRWVLEAPLEERLLVVRHEREHLAASDPLLLALAALAVAAVPWSLPLWWQQRRLRLAVEMDCDARVLDAGASRRLYGHVLVRTAERAPFLSAPAPALAGDAFHLRRRILAMTEKRSARRLPHLLALALVALAAAAAACGAAATGKAVGATHGGGVAAPDTAHGTMILDADSTDGTLGLTWTWGQLHHRDPVENLPVVVALRPGGPAEKAGLRVGDTILAVDGRAARERGVFRGKAPGVEYRARYLRGGEELEARLVVAVMPASWAPGPDFARVGSRGVVDWSM